MQKPDVFHQIVKVAETLIQTKGYNAFSYRDIAAQVGIKTASIHYHFPTKADLGKAVVKHHINGLSAELENLINAPKISYRNKLSLFFDRIFEITYLSERKMCLGGMLASDVLTLPDSIQQEVRDFFHQIEEWLKRLLRQGVKQGEFYLIKDVKLEAAIILSTLEGALLLARLYQDEKRLVQVKDVILARLRKV
ncbi:TetR/AcrR family transcriptional regulator [Coxiella burnetii]|uniref:TetR/AcrR family transcriptional regulator n=1 Tax=Coxiella burnetii TaxID=777 RepID=UPI0021AF7782|nr:TetR/AcrR family transcriptional regulator [Coxiella burnetii]